MFPGSCVRSSGLGVPHLHHAAAARSLGLSGGGWRGQPHPTVLAGWAGVHSVLPPATHPPPQLAQSTHTEPRFSRMPGEGGGEGGPGGEFTSPPSAIALDSPHNRLEQIRQRATASLKSMNEKLTCCTPIDDSA